MKKRLRASSRLNQALLGFTLLASATGFSQSKLNQTVKAQSKTEKAAALSQKNVDKIAEETDEMIQEYGTTLSRIDTIKIYNQQIEKLIGSQLEEMVSIKKQIDSIEGTHQAVVPLMIRMVATIEKFVEFDLPFLPKERKERIESLKKMMSRADVTTSEKYRRVMEAYQVENDYGRTIEAYRDTIKLAGNSLTVDFLRVGRVLLAYQSIDGQRSGLWNSKEKQWQELPDSYQKEIRNGLRIARKQAAPDLIALPIPSPEAVQ